MRDQSVLKSLRKQQAMNDTGRHGAQPIAQRGQAQLGVSEADLLSLPQDISSLQNLADASGNLLFMAGFSAAGGGDAIGS